MPPARTQRPTGLGRAVFTPQPLTSPQIYSGFDSEGMSEEIQNLKLHDDGSSSSKDNKRKSKKKKGMQPPTICLFVEHDCPEMSHSLYMIHLPLDLSDYDQMIDSDGFMADSKYISPVLTFSEMNRFLPHSASVSLGSKIYFFGGILDRVQGSSTYKMRLAHQVQVFDTDHPEQGMRSVAPMTGPKQTPFVFVADGMIYALGSAWQSCEGILPGCKATGFFERYDPGSDHWEVLPDPPLSYDEWKGVELLDQATVVGRRVFIGAFLHVVFNLDIQDWEPTPPQELAARFPYGSIFVQDSASFYHLRGPGVWKPGTIYLTEHYSGKSLQVVKRGPLTTTATKGGNYDSSLLKDCCLAPGKEQVMAEGIDLDENKFFTDYTYLPWRDIFHMGGRFFCYVVTAPLVDSSDFTHDEPYSRGVWINIFKEVPAHADKDNYSKTRFRSLASFCYKIDTNFRSHSRFVRCSILGTVPDSWINAPLKNKQETMLKHRNEESEVLHFQMGTTMQGRSGATGDYDLKKLLAVREEENSRLAAELARKNELLKAYEALLAKTGHEGVKFGNV